MTAASEARKRDAIVDGLIEAWSHGDRYSVYPGSSISDDHLLAEAARTGLEADGWVILRAESVRRAQERLALAKANAEWERESASRTQTLLAERFEVERRLSDRITFLYGEARARGASIDDLKGPA